MGCSNSKFDPEGEEVPAKIRPLLRRRFEEIKRLRKANAFKGATLSKKQLLKDGVEEDDHSPIPSLQDMNERKSISSLEGSVGSAKMAPEPVSDKTRKEVVKIMNQEKSTKQDDHSSPRSVQDINESKSISSSEGSVRSAKVAPEPESDKTCKEFVEIMNQEKSTKQDNKDEEKEEKKVVEPLVALEEVMVVETDEGEDKEEDEDERRLSDAFICPGSPSFRVYCVQSLDIDKEDSKDDNTHKKSPSGDSVEIPESVNSSEDSETKTKKKAWKGGKFRRVIPKGRPGAVKNLLNVKSCYNPACSGHDNTRLLSAKAPA